MREGQVPGAAATTTAPIAPATVQAGGTYECSNRTVTVSGNGSTVTFTGTCQSVTVTGRNDTVHIGTVGAITVTGSDDHVTWHSGPAGDPPTVRDSGQRDEVSRG